MRNNSTFIGRWLYSKPNLRPNKDGNIVWISKASVGPLEVYEWGMDSNNIPYESYKWLENDCFEDTNYFKNIDNEELRRQVDLIISLFKSNGLSEWAEIYENYRRENHGRLQNY